MQRYFIYLAYNGTNYHGWQMQPNGISIQEELSKAISTILRTETSIVGAGRTDAGVHAKRMIAHFDSETECDETFIKKLNGFLPNDISVFDIRKTTPNAHARFDALKRQYEYHVYTYKNPFLEQFAHRIPAGTNFEAMNVAAKYLFEYSDFTSFSKLHTDTKTNLCTIMRAEWQQLGEKWIFTIEANRFLRNMVRAIVGTLLCVGRGSISTDDFRQIIEQKNRGAAAASAPAKGLFLTDVFYPDNLFI